MDKMQITTAEHKTLADLKSEAASVCFGTVFVKVKGER